jgi:mRNA interferase RelE/StbE
MSWEIEFLSEARLELNKLDGSAKKQVEKGILKTSTNPLPKSEGGYGEPLGNKGGINLTGLCRVKFRDLGLRVVYALKRVNNKMTVGIVDVREDDKVYREAERRRRLYNL